MEQLSPTDRMRDSLTVAFRYLQETEEDPKTRNRLGNDLMYYAVENGISIQEVVVIREEAEAGTEPLVTINGGN